MTKTPQNKKRPGSDLLSHGVPATVPSALKGLTSVFGMGTGVSPSAWPPEQTNLIVPLKLHEV